MGTRLRATIPLLSILALCTYSGGRPLHADIVRMRDGRIVEGRIRSQNSKMLMIRTPRGTRRIFKRDVDEIIYRAYKFPAASPKPSGAPDSEKTARKKSATATKPVKPGTKTATKPTDNSTGRVPRMFRIMGRAALLPGWGHVYAHRAERGRWVGRAFAAGAGIALALNFYTLERERILETAARDSLNTALFLPAGSALGATLDFRRAAGIVLIDRWNGKARRHERAASRSGAAFSLLFVFYFAQILDAAWPELSRSLVIAPAAEHGSDYFGAGESARVPGLVFAWRFSL